MLSHAELLMLVVTVAQSLDLDDCEATWPEHGPQYFARFLELKPLGFILSLSFDELEQIISYSQLLSRSIELDLLA